MNLNRDLLTIEQKYRLMVSILKWVILKNVSIIYVLCVSSQIMMAYNDCL